MTFPFAMRLYLLWNQQSNIQAGEAEKPRLRGI
jgi:hypothetical protein